MNVQLPKDVYFCKMEFNMTSLNDLKQCAEDILLNYKDRRVFAFYGEMGAGKTTLIKELCRALNVIDQVNSPTFSIINEYETADNSSVYHADFYRIKDEQEAINIGFMDYLDSGCYCFIEWPEKIYNLLPLDSVKVQISVNESERILTTEQIEND